MICANKWLFLKDTQEYIWLKEVPAHVLQSTIHDLADAYSKFFAKKSKYPKFKKKSNKQSATFDVQTFSIKNNEFRIAKCKTPLKIKWSRELPRNKLSSVTITKTPSGEYYASFLAYYIPEKTAGTKITGIDAGITTLATLSDGTYIPNPRHYTKTQKKLARAQRSLCRKKKGSANRNKARLTVAKIHSTITNQRADYLHKLTTTLVRENQAIAIESLKVKNMSKNRRLAKHILDAAWGMMRQQLTYKCKASQHCKLFLADPYFPSTQLCYACHTKPKVKIKLGVTKWTCGNCGFVHCRDHNAAKNLELLALSNYRFYMHDSNLVYQTNSYVPYYDYR